MWNMFKKNKQLKELQRHIKELELIEEHISELNQKQFVASRKLSSYLINNKDIASENFGAVIHKILWKTEECKELLELQSFQCVYKIKAQLIGYEERKQLTINKIRDLKQALVGKYDF